MAPTTETTRLLQERAPVPSVPFPDGTDPLNLTKLNRTGILLGTFSGNFLASLNTTLVATLITSISSEFEAANQASWLGTSYLLSTATFTPLYGRLSNVLGRRGANQLALASLFLGTLMCGMAPSINWLIAGRFIAGCGGGGLFTTSSIITSDLYSVRSRGLTQGIASIFSGFGMGIGGPFGGWMTDTYGWRMAFLLQLPLFFISFVFTQRNLRYILPGKVRSTRDILRRIDYFGTLTLLISVSCTLVGLSRRYNSDRPWSEFGVWAPFVGAVLGSIAFVLVELFLAVEPVLAPELLRMRVPLLVAISSFLVPICNFATMYFYPLWFELVAGQSATQAGLHLTPNSVSMSLGSLFAGYIMHRSGRYKMLNLTFGILPCLALLFIIRLKPDSSPIVQWLSIIPLGFGNAVVLQTTLIALLVSIPSSHLAVGTGFVQLFRGIGQVLGVAAPSAVFQRTLEKELRLRITAENKEDLIRIIRHNSHIVKTLPLAQQVQARAAFAVSLRLVFIVAAVATFAAFLVRLGIPEQDLDRPKADSALSSEASSDDEESFSRQSSVADATVGFEASSTVAPSRPKNIRRVSVLESDDGMDPEPVARSHRSRSGSIRTGGGFGSLSRTPTRASIAPATVGEEAEEH